MARDLFEDITRPFNGAGARSRFTVPLSLAAHTLAIAAVVVVPLVAADALPALRSRLELSMITALVPPEPPRPRLIRTQPDQSLADPDAAPLDAPDGVTKEPEPPLSDPVGANGGLDVVSGGTPLEHVLAEPPPPPVERQIKTVRPGSQLAPPTKIADASPAYPAIAQSARVQGVVIIQATIGVDGRVIDASVLRSVPLLDEAALAAVRQWRYTPSRLNGEPVAVVMTVTVNFQLR